MRWRVARRQIAAGRRVLELGQRAPRGVTPRAGDLAQQIALLVKYW
jgi:hypothetical protein